MTPIDRLREICFRMPEAVEKETWDHPGFRIRDKIFCGYASEDHEGGSSFSAR